MNSMQHDVFLTGGTGFMGSSLVRELLRRGHQVRALVRPGSESKLATGCEAVPGDALSAESLCGTNSPGGYLRAPGWCGPSQPAKGRGISRDRFEVVPGSGAGGGSKRRAPFRIPQCRAAGPDHAGIPGGPRGRGTNGPGERHGRDLRSSLVCAGPGTSVAVCSDSAVCTGAVASCDARRGTIGSPWLPCNRSRMLWHGPWKIHQRLFRPLSRHRCGRGSTWR